MRKKRKKTKRERIAEGFFPVGEDNLKYAVEKKYSKPDRISLEKVEKTRKIQGKGKKKTPGGKIIRISKKEYKHKKIKLKKDGYELIITEKPQAALTSSWLFFNILNIFSSPI